MTTSRGSTLPSSIGNSVRSREVADELLLHFRRAIAGLLEVPLRERRVERFDAELRVGLDVDVGERALPISTCGFVSRCTNFAFG